MKTKVLVFVAVLALVVTIPAVAGGLSQDPEALSFLGSYEGTILIRGSQRDWEITLAAVDDSGKVTVSRYHVGPVGDFKPVDIQNVTGVFERQDGHPAIVLDVPGQTGHAKVILTKEQDGLDAEIIGSMASGKIVHLKKK
jgi:hypothetical protein